MRNFFSSVTRYFCLSLVRIARIGAMKIGLHIARQEDAIYINESLWVKNKIEVRANSGIKYENQNKMRLQLSINRQGIHFSRNTQISCIFYFSKSYKSKNKMRFYSFFLWTFDISISGHLFLRKFTFLTFLPETYIGIMSIVCDG